MNEASNSPDRENPRCPFCGDQTAETAKPALEGYYRVYTCLTCESEARKKLSRPAKRINPSNFKPQAVDCQECPFGNVHCSVCDDAICEQHIRTFEQYKPYLDSDLSSEMLDRFGSRVYCPLCFQTLLKRQSMFQQKNRPKPTSLRQFTIGIFLLILTVLMTMAAKSCPGLPDKKAPVQQSGHADPSETSPSKPTTFLKYFQKSV